MRKGSGRARSSPKSVPLTKFYIAEDYHQEYFRNNPSQPYCAYVVAPKVAKFRQKFARKLRSA